VRVGALLVSLVAVGKFREDRFACAADRVRERARGQRAAGRRCASLLLMEAVA
jgi:hypothetical protein